jgi:uncharacterized membrane protein YqgA involved in biofilm formation
MKKAKLYVVVFAVLILTATVFAKDVIKVGVNPGPHEELMEIVKGILAEKGIELEIISFADFITPNLALAAGFVTATILYVVGPMAILGSIEDGIGFGYKILLTKSALDGLSSIAFGASLGIGVPFAAVPVFIYQGAITLIASFFGDVASASVIAAVSGCGGLLILAIGLNMLKLTKIRVTNLLPGIVFAPIFTWLLGLL